MKDTIAVELGCKTFSYGNDLNYLAVMVHADETIICTCYGNPTYLRDIIAKSPRLQKHLRDTL